MPTHFTLSPIHFARCTLSTPFLLHDEHQTQSADANPAAAVAERQRVDGERSGVRICAGDRHGIHAVAQILGKHSKRRGGTRDDGELGYFPVVVVVADDIAPVDRDRESRRHGLRRRGDFEELVLHLLLVQLHLL